MEMRINHKVLQTVRQTDREAGRQTGLPMGLAPSTVRAVVEAKVEMRINHKVLLTTRIISQSLTEVGQLHLCQRRDILCRTGEAVVLCSRAENSAI